jgi:hypothetical protein
LSQKAIEKWNHHEDKDQVKFSLVPIIVVGSKYDVFANQYEAAKKKDICSALRYICHANGCDLVFASVKEKEPLLNFRQMLNSKIFEGSVDDND